MSVSNFRFINSAKFDWKIMKMSFDDTYSHSPKPKFSDMLHRQNWVGESTDLLSVLDL